MNLKDTSDHPAESGPRPSRWARLTGRLRGRSTAGRERRERAELPPTAAAGAVTQPARIARRPARSLWDVAAVVALAAGVLLIVGVGLRVGMGALQDAALAAHIDADAADLYWIGVDGLIVVAIIAALVLRNVPGARAYCLGVVAAFTAASGLLQYLHGLGWFTPDRVSGITAPLPWGVVLVIALLVIGTIFCGTHLFVHVLRHLFPGSPPEQAEQVTDRPRQQVPAEGEDPGPDHSDHSDHSDQGDRLDADTEREVRKWFAAIAAGMILDIGGKPVRSKLATQFGIADRQAGYVIADVIRERELAAERAAQEAERAAGEKTAGTPLPPVEPLVPTGSGSANGSGPGATTEMPATVNGSAPSS